MEYLMAHLVGDFLLQTDKMANGKKSNNLICLLHVSFYLIPFFFLGMNWWQIILIGLQHFFQDRTGFVVWFMKIKGSKEFATGPCSPWSIILTDNILHLLWIYLIVGLGVVI